MSKVCRGPCKQVRNVSEYFKKTKSPDGLQPYCKHCEKERKTVYNVEKKDQIKEKKAEYYLLNTDRIIKSIERIMRIK